MTAARAALLAALLLACSHARAQPSDASDVTPDLRGAVVAYRAGDLVTAEANLRQLAPGNPDAEAWLGAVLMDRGLAREGLQALQHAADSGSAEGAHRLGLVFAQGQAGTARNDARALELFEKAAALGNQRAQINVGILYFRGQGVPRDLVQARAWLEKAAARNDPYALYALGRAMDDTLGLAAADPVRAADLYRRAAELGHPLAAMRYGLALADGYGVKKEPTAALKWLTYAQANGVAEAGLALGDLYARTPPQRDKTANVKTLQSAVSWYEAAAQAGVASAQFKLANAYIAGAGVARDPAQAQRWYERAAQQGLPEAEYALGLFLIGGMSGTADPVEGYKWLLISERAGYPDSRPVREKAADQVPERERKRVEALAQKFAAQPERPAADERPPQLAAPMRP
jgi:TPR repeat protein